MFPVVQAEGCRDRKVNGIHNDGEWMKYPLRINASSVATPSRLLATSSIFPSTLSTSGNQILRYRAMLWNKRDTHS